MPQKQCTSIVRFQLLDLAAHGTLRTAQMIGGPADAAELSRRDECLQRRQRRQHTREIRQRVCMPCMPRLRIFRLFGHRCVAIVATPPARQLPANYAAI